MAKTNIEWAEESWNPVVGCSIHSAGCTNCYAMAMAFRLERISLAHQEKHGTPGPMAHYVGTTKLVKGKPVWTGQTARAPDSIFNAPLKKRKPTEYFVGSMTDIFRFPLDWEMLDEIFGIMCACPHHLFKILTKRTDGMREYLNHWRTRERILQQAAYHAPYGKCTWPLANVWAGTSIENQAAAHNRLEDLAQTNAVVRWVSAEPLIGPVDFRPWLYAIDLIVVGGESGPGARDNGFLDNARDILEQTRPVKTSFFGKQGYLKKALPADLMVRESPQPFAVGI